MNKQINKPEKQKGIEKDELQKKQMATQTQINRVKGLGSLAGYRTIASGDFYF